MGMNQNTYSLKIYHNHFRGKFMEAPEMSKCSNPSGKLSGMRKDKIDKIQIATVLFIATIKPQQWSFRVLAI